MRHVKNLAAVAALTNLAAPAAVEFKGEEDDPISIVTKSIEDQDIKRIGAVRRRLLGSGLPEFDAPFPMNLAGLGVDAT